jgi:processive 1,2-diacylglycerol beta-glucosyltransferase
VKLEVLGWTDQIPVLLKTHHCVIAKAGGASVQEAMAARCPLLINYIVPGQEEGNAAQAIDAGAARLLGGDAEIDQVIAGLLADERRGLKAMRACAEKAGNPAAAKQIADFILAKTDHRQP